MAGETVRVVAEVVGGKVAFDWPVEAGPPPGVQERVSLNHVVCGVDLGGTVRASHGPGFASVDWYGTVYTFTPKQRAIVAALWQAWESGDLYVAEPTLLRIADSCGDRIRDLFRRHPAWGTMIVTGVLTGGPPESFQLVAPES